MGLVVVRVLVCGVPSWSGWERTGRRQRWENDHDHQERRTDGPWHAGRSGRRYRVGEKKILLFFFVISVKDESVSMVQANNAVLRKVRTLSSLFGSKHHHV
jgi:hypothetical protein